MAGEGTMKKNIILLVLLAMVDLLAAPGWAARAAASRPGMSTGSGQIAAAAEDLVKLLPRSTAVVVVNDIKRIMEIDAVDKALQDPKVKVRYDEFVKMGGIDPRRDVAYVGIGAPNPEDARRAFMSIREAFLYNASIIVSLKYDKVRLQGFIKEKIPGAKEESYNGVTVFTNLNGDSNKQTAPFAGANLGRMSFQAAFLDASHIVIGDEGGVKGVIDVYLKKAEPLAINPEMTALVSRVDKSGILWCAASYPAELMKKASDSNPQLKALEGLKGLTVTIDDKKTGLFAEVRSLGGTKEQNAAMASNLNGLRAAGAIYAAQEPAFGELLNGVAVTSGEDYVRLTVTLSYETIGGLWRLAEPKEWQFLTMRAASLSGEGDHQRAVEVGKQALELAEKNLGPDHPDVADSLHILAEIYRSQGEYAQAEPLFKRSLAIAEEAFGPDDQYVAAVLEDLARLYAAQRQFAEAESLLKRMLAIKEKAFGPDHREVADSLSVLALLYTAQRRLAEAEPLCKRALAIREKILGPEHPDVAQSLTDLAFLCYTPDRYAEAEPLFKRSLAIREKILGPDHPEVAEGLKDLGMLYHIQGRDAEAEPFYKRALAIREKALGPDHPDVAKSLDMLAFLYRGRGQYEEAEPLFKRSLAIREKALGPDHPDVAKSLKDLAQLHYYQRQYAKAEPLYKRALGIREKALGPDHPEVAEGLKDLGMLYHIQGQYAEAEPFYKRALAIREKAFGPDHPNVAESLSLLAELYRAAKRETEAKELEARAARIRSIKR
jgi:tetratricopeptide (TPR) repeat protein